MVDKDTKLLEEAYKQLNEEYGVDFTYNDETSSHPQQGKVIPNNDGTITVRFGHSFTLSHIDRESVKDLASSLITALKEAQKTNEYLRRNDNER